MKKIVLNISEHTYEKLRFEAMHEQKSIHDLIKERIFHKPFAIEVLEAYENFMESEIEKIVTLGD